MKGSAPEMIVTSRDWTENGRTSPAMSFHRYRFIARSASVHTVHRVVGFDVGFESSFSVFWLWDSSSWLPMGRDDNSKGAWELSLIVRRCSQSWCGLPVLSCFFDIYILYNMAAMLANSKGIGRMIQKDRTFAAALALRNSNKK